ncbi:MAG: flippase-like domain-containing protein [Anaerolineales bacterium]|nr:flippase-like domain-containing protein [Anaerolineales bacterium]
MEVEEQKQKKRITGLIRALVSAALIAALIWQIDFVEIQEALASFSIWRLWAVPFLFLINMLLSVWRWKILLSQLGVKEKYKRLFKIYLIGFFWSNFLPSTIGGDGYRFLQIRAGHPGKDKEVFSSILLDRAYGFGALIFIHFLTAAFFYQIVISSQILRWVEIGLAGLFVLGALAWMQRRLLLKVRLGQWQLFQKLMHKIESVVSIVEKQSKLTVVVCLVISISSVFVGSWAWQIHYWAAGQQITLLFSVFTSTLSSIAGALPISVNGLGLIEAAQVVAMKAYQVPEEIVIVVSVSVRLMNLFITLSSALVYLYDFIFNGNRQTKNLALERYDQEN